MEHTEHSSIEDCFVDYFLNNFTSQGASNIEKTVEVVKDKVNPDMREQLNTPFTAEKVYCAIKDMKSLAAPGPDGLPALFYHHYWDVLGTEAALDVLNNNADPSPFNSTNICLIPKKNNPSHPSDFWPIALKIITKTIANRLKPILGEVISGNQSAFLPGRLISDNTLMSYEIFHYLSNTSSKKGYMGMKTVMAKAYDKVEWTFLEATMLKMGFPHQFVSTIMRCVTTVTFSILIDGSNSKEFQPQRGLRQGDPLSPYLFIICVDVFSELINKANNNKLIHGVKIVNGAPEITHLFFADANLTFCKATT